MNMIAHDNIRGGKRFLPVILLNVAEYACNDSMNHKMVELTDDHRLVIWVFRQEHNAFANSKKALYGHVAIQTCHNDIVMTRFGGMVKAFRYGAPPHGGCAAGIDRIVMLLADEVNIRQVIMFPMNQRAEDLMMGAPSEPTNEQLRDLRLRVIPKE